MTARCFESNPLPFISAMEYSYMLFSPYNRRENKLPCLIFKDHHLQVQEWSISVSRKSSKGSRRPAWMNKELLTRFSHKGNLCKIWKQREVTQEENRDTVQAWCPGDEGHKNDNCTHVHLQTAQRRIKNRARGCLWHDINLHIDDHFQKLLSEDQIPRQRWYRCLQSSQAKILRKKKIKMKTTYNHILSRKACDYFTNGDDKPA
ncbi:uncharacterized protein [Melanerpes formicivorus]|uniref:uncharacterized protein n=1 Tax=Melanerpes formicivorus TaxID=211600 RepID=UPI00358F22D2